MKFFQKKSTVDTGRVWNLFADLAEMSPKQFLEPSNRQIASHTLEIISSALRGGVDLEQERFNLWGYEAVCNDRDRKNPKKENKEIPLHTSDSMPEGKDMGLVISLNQVKAIEDAFDSMINDTAVQQIVESLFTLRKKHAHLGYDLVIVLLGALDEIKDSVTILQKACAEDEEVKDMVETLLTSDGGKIGIRKAIEDEVDRREIA